jgi:hypothetical protein
MTDDPGTAGPIGFAQRLRRDLARSSRLLLVPALWIALAFVLKGAGPGRPEPLLDGLPLLALAFLGGLALFLLRDSLPGASDESIPAGAGRGDLLRSKIAAFLLIGLAGALLVLAALLVAGHRAPPATPASPPRLEAVPVSGPERDSDAPRRRPEERS